MQFQLQSSRSLTAALAISAALFFTSSRPAVCADEPLRYLTAGHPDSALLAPPPLPGSGEFAADMAQVVAVHRACTSNEAELAFSEKKFSIFNFTPAIGDFFQPGKLPKTEAFFERVQKEAETVTDLAKDYWKRPRPYTIDTNLVSGKLEKSFGYQAVIQPRAPCSRWCWRRYFPINARGSWPWAEPRLASCLDCAALPDRYSRRADVCPSHRAGDAGQARIPAGIWWQ